VKRAIAGVALAATLAVAAATTRPLWLAPDVAQAQAWLHAAADRRDASAEAALARWSDRGNVAARHAYATLLGHRNDAESQRTLERVLADGADAGDADDATRLAELLSRAGVGADARAGTGAHAGAGASAGAGTGADASRDARVARLLAQGGAGHVPAAARLLALRALDASHGAPDPARAATLMGQAADGGDVPAMFLYANMLRAGQGVPRDDARALALYERAGDADYAPAIQALAIAWRYGELGLQADASQSKLMDHEAAEALAHATR
jgi:TPR repeat protein